MGADVKGNTQKHKKMHSEKSYWKMKLLLHIESVSNTVLAQKASQAGTAKQQVASEIN